MQLFLASMTATVVFNQKMIEKSWQRQNFKGFD